MPSSGQAQDKLEIAKPSLPSKEFCWATSHETLTSSSIYSNIEVIFCFPKYRGWLTFSKNQNYLQFDKRLRWSSISQQIEVVFHLPKYWGRLPFSIILRSSFFVMESQYFCDLGAHAKFHHPSSLLSGRKVRESERRGGKIMPLRVATMFMPAAQGQRTHSIYRLLHCPIQENRLSVTTTTLVYRSSVYQVTIN